MTEQSHPQGLARPDREPDLGDIAEKTQPAEGGRDEVRDLPGAEGGDPSQVMSDASDADGGE